MSFGTRMEAPNTSTDHCHQGVFGFTEMPQKPGLEMPAGLTSDAIFTQEKTQIQSAIERLLLIERDLRAPYWRPIDRFIYIIGKIRPRP